MMRLVALISDDHSYDECEIQLSNTMYLLYSIGDNIYVTVDFPNSIEDSIVDRVGDDLLSLGLLTESIEISKVQ